MIFDDDVTYRKQKYARLFFVVYRFKVPQNIAESSPNNVVVTLVISFNLPPKIPNSIELFSIRSFDTY